LVCTVTKSISIKHLLLTTESAQYSILAIYTDNHLIHNAKQKKKVSAAADRTAQSGTMQRLSTC